MRKSLIYNQASEWADKEIERMVIKPMNESEINNSLRYGYMNGYLHSQEDPDLIERIVRLVYKSPSWVDEDQAAVSEEEDILNTTQWIKDQLCSGSSDTL